jgi:PEP-CTERM motif
VNARTRLLGYSLAVGLVVLGWGGPAAALGLTGKTLDGGYYLPDASTLYPQAVFSPSTFVVGAGQETSVDLEGVTTLLIDFDDTSLTITLQTGLSSPGFLADPFNGLIFDSVLPLDIASATVDGATTMIGFDDSRVAFDANQLRVNWQNLSYDDGTVVKIDFTFVPEPGTGLLLGLGLLGLGVARRRSGASPR